MKARSTLGRGARTREESAAGMERRLARVHDFCSGRSVPSYSQSKLVDCRSRSWAVGRQKPNQRLSHQRRFSVFRFEDSADRFGLVPPSRALAKRSLRQLQPTCKGPTPQYRLHPSLKLALVVGPNDCLVSVSVSRTAGGDRLQTLQSSVSLRSTNPLPSEFANWDLKGE